MDNVMLLELPTFVLSTWHPFNKKNKTCVMVRQESNDRKHPEISSESQSLLAYVGSPKPTCQ